MPSRNKIVLACAGSGKTWGICRDAINSHQDNKKRLLISYTNKGVESIKKEYAKQNAGVIDSDVCICTWFQFLLKELIKPYQSYYLKNVNMIKSYDFENMYGKISFNKKNSKNYYLNRNYDVKANNASEFSIHLNNISEGLVLKRLEEVYSHIYIDEIQDLVGADIDLLQILFLSSIYTCCVGDYKQSTLRTHNAKGGKTRCGEYVFDYFEKIKKTHYLDIEKCNCSKRFVQDIAKFANLIYPGNSIVSSFDSTEKNTGVYLISNSDLSIYIRYYNPTILRYDKNIDTLNYPALNFGMSKGMTMDRVLIFPNGPIKKFIVSGAALSSPHKYYVAVTRPKYNLAFAVDNVIENDMFKIQKLYLGDNEIIVAKFVPT